MKYAFQPYAFFRYASLWRTGGWVGVCILLLAPAAVASSAAARSIVDKAGPVRSIAADTDRVLITLSESVSFSQAALPGDAKRNLKDRCYVDLTPAILDRQAQRYVAVDSAMILQVRAAQFRADTVRVVLDLVSSRECQVTLLSDPPRLQISIGPPAEEIPRADATTEPEEAVARVEDESPAAPVATPVIESKVQPSEAATQTAAKTLPPEETEAEQTTTRATATIHPLAESPSRVIALEEAYQLAVVNEEQVAIAARELAKAELLPWRAIALMTPRGEIGGSYSRNKDAIAFNAPPEAQSLFGGSSVIRPRNNWLTTFQVTQPLLEPLFFPSWRLGKEAVREEEERYEFTIRGVLFGVAQAYYEVLRFEAQVKVTQDALNLAQEELKRARVRFRVGEVTKTDVLRAEVAVERAGRALVVDRNRLKLARAVLARTVGLSEVVGVQEPSPPQQTGSDYTSLLDQAYAQRQDLRAQNLAVGVARERKNLVLTRYFPQVNAQFSYPRLDPETFANRDEFWTLFVNLRWAIFDGGKREIDLLEANENFSQAELRVTELEKQIRVEVREALLTVETLHATLETLRKEVTLARENYDMTSKQYRVGLSTSLDINTSLNALNQVRTQLIDQTYTYQIALLNLDNAIGVFAQDYLPQR